LVVTQNRQKQKKQKWIFRFTKPSTKKVSEYTIGPAFGWDYYGAQSEAHKLHFFITKGIDPVDTKRQEKAKGITYAEACDAFIKHHAPPGGAHNRWRSTKNVENLLGQAASLNKTPVGAITSTMLAEALDPVWQQHPYQVRRALPVIAEMLDYAEFKGWRTGKNPAAWKGNMKIIYGKLKKRDNHHASLPFQDMPDFMPRLRARQTRGSSAAALEFQILTATRPGEVRGARWSEIDMVNSVWTLPPDRTKQDRQHRVPLSKRCMEILAVQQEYRIQSEFVFTGNRRTQNRAMDPKAVRVLLWNMKVPVTAHGFRSSFRNWAFTTRQDRDLAELSLGHSVAKDRTESAYLIVDGLEERRPLMEAWAAFCSGS
jgi:integrase